MYKGELTGFPQEIVEKILDEQERQGNKRDVSVFEKKAEAQLEDGGFDWESTNQDYLFWESILSYGELDYFYEDFYEKYKPTLTQQIEKLHQPFMSLDEKRGFDMCKKLVLNLLNSQKINE